MRKASLRKNHDEFERDMDWYLGFLSRVLDQELDQDDFIEIVESLVIRLCAVWEAFVEGEMIDCLNIDCCRTYADEVELTLPDHPSRDLCEALLVGPGYVDFRNVDSIKAFAERVLPQDVNPFRLIRKKPTAKRIDEVGVMRNYLSHYSGKSRRALHKMYRESWQLQSFRQPGDFLLAYAGKRLSQYIDAFAQASKQMRGILN